jgi:hypothetical protein
MIASRLSAAEVKHLKHLHHRKNYLERKLSSVQPTLQQRDLFEMHKREIRALEWVLLKFQSPFFNKSPGDNQPAVPATEKTLDTE